MWPVIFEERVVRVPAAIGIAGLFVTTGQILNPATQVILEMWKSEKQEKLNQNIAIF
jgi:ABC-type glucose/galactose transport system permease subunit